LAAATLFTTAVPAISNRMLLPIYIGLVLAFISGYAIIQDVWFMGRRRWWRALPWAIALWGLVYYVPQTINDIVVPLHAGSGPTSYRWRDSPTMAAVRGLPGNVPIVSNESFAVEVWAERPAIQMIQGLPPSFIGEQAPYGASQSDPAQVAFREHRAALVIFEDELPRQLEDAFGEASLARLETIFNGLVVGRRLADGVVYYSP
jgi:hypothetical protein